MFPTMSTFRKLNNPAGERNKQPILGVLRQFIDTNQPGKKLLEISSGVGLHVSYLAAHFPNVHFHPSEYDISLFGSIEAYRKDASVPNINSPIHIDISTPYTDWSKDHDTARVAQKENFDYMLNINMMHISPISCSEGLFWNASRLLKHSGLLFTYGPYAVDGKLTPDSNVQFDASLRSRNPSWGIRDIRELEKLASNNGILLRKAFDLPSNNKCLVWEKTETAEGVQ
ncbi:methyltransferase-like 26 isoform X2 [Uranotaenia lowii]|uniref:methyltransferase-like 26 isoform X2 n=1 Tax=Uranotaenia lowii TaxID=190385 RepID=UPI0024795D94|nr:methyltransferase-like 26 isoform X2 [Uranotaenia lowii]